MDTLNGSTLDQIEQLKKRIEALKEEGENEIRAKLKEARLVVEELERQLSTLTGRPSATEIQQTKERKPRSPSIPDEELKGQVLEAVAQHGKNGINAKSIGEHIGQEGARVRAFLKAHPEVLKRAGNGPGTKFFLP